MKQTLIKISVLLLTLVLAFSSCGKNKDKKKGEKGDDGKSAYQLAQEAGFEGTLEEWLVSLVGAKGEIGAEVSDISLISHRSCGTNSGSGTRGRFGRCYYTNTCTQKHK